MSMRNDRPSTRRWARIAVFGGGALVLLLIGYVIGATLFPIVEPSAPIAQPTPDTTTPDATLIPTFTPSPVAPTSTPTEPPTHTPQPTPTAAPPTPTPILIVVTAPPSPTFTATWTPQPTATPVPPTNTPVPSPTSTWTPVFTPTWTPVFTPTWTPQPTPTATLMPTPTNTATPTATFTATSTATPTETETTLPTSTATATPTATTTATPTATATTTLTPTATATQTATASATPTATATATPTATTTATPTATATATLTPTATATQTATATPTLTPTPTPTETATPTATVTPGLTPTMQWIFASEPVTVAYLNQTYVYTVTFDLEDIYADESNIEPPLPTEEAGPPQPEELEAPTDASTLLNEEAGPVSEGDENPPAPEDQANLQNQDRMTEEEGSEDELPPGGPVVIAGGALTVEAPVLPTWLRLVAVEEDEKSVLLTGVPLEEDEGEHPVLLTATDAFGVVITQSFTLTVELDPAPFRFEAFLFETGEDEPLEGVLNAYHAEGLPIYFSLLDPPQHGAVDELDSETGAFVYKPDLDFFGEDIFTVELSDDLQRIITAPVTITVNAVNDPPRIDMDDVYTVTVGDAVTITVVVTDVDSAVYTVTVEGLPPNLMLIEDEESRIIAGEVAPEALESGPYVTLIAAVDDEGAETQHEITWVILAPNAGNDEEGATDTTPDVVLPVTQAIQLPPGQEGLAYAWQVPPPYEGCPSAPDALTPAPLTEDASLLDDLFLEAPAQGPGLLFTVTLPAGDYALLVCGCAPTYTIDDRASLPVNNQALYAEIDGDSPRSEEGKVLPLTGFAEANDFVWRPLAMVGAGNAPFLVSLDEGEHLVTLWMADDGLLVHSIRLMPATALTEAQMPIAERCISTE